MFETAQRITQISHVPGAENAKSHRRNASRSTQTIHTQGRFGTGSSDSESGSPPVGEGFIPTVFGPVRAWPAYPALSEVAEEDNREYQQKMQGTGTGNHFIPVLIPILLLIFRVQTRQTLQED